ncbi:MAG: serine hydrolase [Moraxella sp.]|nr:serine hydrolase [Moraxella sp.]
MNTFSKKQLTTSLGMLLACTAGMPAQALLVDDSQQKVIYIGKGSADSMKAVKVNNIQSKPEVHRYVQTSNSRVPTPSSATTSSYNSAGTVTTRTYPTTQPSTNTNAYTYSESYSATLNSFNNHQANTASQSPSTYTTNYSGGYGNYGGFDRLAVSTNSAAVAVYDLQTGQPIYEKNINSKRSIASITKVMTAMVLVDAGLDMREEITLIASDLVGAKKASTNLRAGDRMSRSEFMLLMLMKSENPAAKALARTYPGGYNAFISAMNRKATSLGMHQTNFSDSSGLDPRNVSSASDLVKMMRVVNSDNRYQQVRSFSTSTSYDFHIKNYNLGSRVYKANNTSRLVRAGSYPIGASKTGYIREAGYCVVMETHVNNRPAVVVLLGASASNNRWNDAENILTQLAYLN